MTTFAKYLLLPLILLGVIIPSFAITKEEMEKARAISAKIYLRWANNGSGYLDEFSVSTISDLEKKIREKEKTNLAPFKAIAIPADYESWDKAKLVEFWSKTALNSSGLNQDGVSPGSRNRIKSAINAMSVTPPSPKEVIQEQPAPQEPPAESIKEEPKEQPEEITELQEEMELVSDSIENADSIPTPTAKKSSSSTWLYIVALIILIAAVIFLVVYASKTLGKQQKGNQEESAPESKPAESVTDKGEIDKIRTKYAENLAAKQEEIRMLTNEVMALREENKRIAQEAERLRMEASKLRNISENEIAANVERVRAPRSSETPEEKKTETREIFLGRVNANGVFVRADRTFNPRHSIYRLRTNDGFTGTFRVVDDNSVVETTFTNPQEMLGGGCIAMDITNTRGKNEIITESAGTAIFENNCWRVIRKAKIRYE